MASETIILHFCSLLRRQSLAPISTLSLVHYKRGKSSATSQHIYFMVFCVSNSVTQLGSLHLPGKRFVTLTECVDSSFRRDSSLSDTALGISVIMCKYLMPWFRKTIKWRIQNITAIKELLYFHWYTKYAFLLHFKNWANTIITAVFPSTTHTSVRLSQRP